MHANAEHWHDSHAASGAESQPDTIVPHAPRGNAVLDAPRPIRGCKGLHRWVTQSVTKCMPTRSIGTIVMLREAQIVARYHRSSRSAWECSSGRSASNPRMQGAVPLGDAERHEMHANAEHWHDSHAASGAESQPDPHRFSRSAWECSSGRSASNPRMQGAAPLGGAERHDRHSHAEREERSV